MRQATLAEHPRDTFNIDLAINIGGALVAAQSVAPKMSERDAGTILPTGGGFALEPNPEYLSLSIGKAGIRAMAHALFQSLKEKGIHVATHRHGGSPRIPWLEGCRSGRGAFSRVSPLSC
jgi:short-subunit dehydrogenase